MVCRGVLPRRSCCPRGPRPAGLQVAWLGAGSRLAGGRGPAADGAGKQLFLTTRSVSAKTSPGRFPAARGEKRSSHSTMVAFHFQEQSLGYSDAAARAKVYRGTPPVTALVTLWGRGIILPRSRERHREPVRGPSR